MFFNISKFLDIENERLDLWYVASYLFGILTYFSLDNDPNNKIIYFLTSGIFLFSIIILASRSILIKFFLKLVICFSAGFLVSLYKTNSISNITIKNTIENIEISGIIERIKPTPYGSQITLSSVKSRYKEDIPERVRINFSKYDTKLFLTGDLILLNASLSPIPGQVVPGGYNFKQVAFFSKIGAVGTAKSYPEILQYNNGIDYSSILSGVRKNLYNLLIEKLGFKNGNFAAAIFLGETGGIDKSTLNNMRFAGISHILCVSGLHLSIVASLFLIGFRVIFNLSDWISYNFDIKKLSGYMSLIFSFIYLLLTGMQIAATRAFIMTSVMIISIIINKQPYPIRSLSLACVIILTMNPEYAIHPSFQLSFIAVLSLLVGYEFYTNSKKLIDDFGGGVISNIKLYIFSNLYSSLVASLATSPIVMYHFYVYSNYSILANLVAVPLVSFIIMPIGIIAIILGFLSFSMPLFWIIGNAISLIKYTAYFIVSLPYSLFYTGFISNIQITLFLIGFFWICFWKSKIRYLGFLGILLFTIGLYSSKKPTILINKESNYVAFYDDSEVFIYSKKLSAFAKNFIANWFGVQKAKFLKQKDLEKFCVKDDKTICKFEIDFSNNQITYKGNSYKFFDMSYIYLKGNELKIEDFSRSRKMFGYIH